MTISAKKDHAEPELHIMQDRTGERRETSRFCVSSDDDWVTTVPKFKVADLSAYGISLNSTYLLKRGDVIKVHVKDGPSADVVVVACKMTNPPVANFDPIFHVFCRFVSHREGRQIIESLHG